MRAQWRARSPLRQEHKRLGFAWDDQLETVYADAERALLRGLGPATKAAEIPPTVWTALDKELVKRKENEWRPQAGPK